MTASATKKVDPEIINILDQITWTEGRASLPQLDRKTYLKVDKVLKACNGKWNRTLKSHTFDSDGELLVRSIINSGEYIDPKKAFQYFPSPPDVVRRVCDLADIQDGDTVLEPSAGCGAIVKELLARKATVTAVELDPSHTDTLTNLFLDSGLPHSLIPNRDFLSTIPSESLFDAVVMNPPFSRLADCQHVFHAYSFLRPGGRLVSVMSTGFTFRDCKFANEFREFLDEDDKQHAVIHLPPKSFAQSGTLVNTCIVKIDRIS